VIDSFRYPNISMIRQKNFHEGCEQINNVGLGITVGWCDYYKYDLDLQYIRHRGYTVRKLHHQILDKSYTDVRFNGRTRNIPSLNHKGK